ncbi:MAG: hypothetical protein M3171_04280 [Actinomycetota bacterium]|nr:hypothetical protein [Actinomycetota bacterium]
MNTSLQDRDPEVQAQAADHLARQSVQVTEQPVGAAAWQQMTSTYLVYAQDRDAPPPRQHEFARRADNVVEARSRPPPVPATTRSCLIPPRSETSC